VALAFEVAKLIFDWEPKKHLRIWIFLIFGFAASSFLAWEQEYEKSHPALSLNILDDGFCERLDISDGQSVIHSFKVAIVFADIKNRGPQRSIAEDYLLTVSVPGRKETVKTKLLELPSTMNDLKILNVTISPKKLLYKQTLSPLSSGDKKVGFLVFVLDDSALPMLYLEQKGTTFTLSCTDVGGNTITATSSPLTGVNHGRIDNVLPD